MVDIVALSIPAFLVLIIAELIVDRMRGGDFVVPDAHEEGRPKYETHHGRAVGWWVTLNFALATLALGGLLLFEEHVPQWLIIAAALGLLLALPSTALADGGNSSVSVTAQGRVTSQRYSPFPVDTTGAASPDADEIGARATLLFELMREAKGDGLDWGAEVEVALIDGAVDGKPRLAGDDLPGREAHSYALESAYMHAAKERRFGFKAGLMSSNWGLGLVANDGKDRGPGPAGWFKHQRLGDRVLRATVFGMPAKGLLLAAAGDRVWHDDIASEADGDVAYQGVLAVRQYLRKDRWFGVYAVRRAQEDVDGKTLDATVADFATDLTFGATRLQGEAAFIVGDTSFGASPEHPIHDLDRIGTAMRITHGLGAGLTADLEGAWLSGDATMDDSVSSAFRADRNFQQGLVLFPRVLATWTGRSRLTASDPDVVGVPTEDLDKLATDGALQGVATLFPKLGWQATPGLELYAGALLAWATADVLDPYNTRTGGGTARNHLDLAADSAYLGTEYDFGMRMGTQLPWHLGEMAITAEYGVLSPGGGLPGLTDIHGGRITLGWYEPHEEGGR